MDTINNYKYIGLLVLASAFVQVIVLKENEGIIWNCILQAVCSLALAVIFYYLFNQKLEYSLKRLWEIFLGTLILTSFMDKFSF